MLYKYKKISRYGYDKSEETYIRSHAIHWLKQGFIISVFKLNQSQDDGSLYERQDEIWIGYINRNNNYYNYKYSVFIEAQDTQRIFGYYYKYGEDQVHCFGVFPALMPSTAYNIRMEDYELHDRKTERLLKELFKE